MNFLNSKWFYRVAPFTPALMPMLFGLLWATASLVAENRNEQADSQMADAEAQLVQSTVRGIAAQATTPLIAQADVKQPSELTGDAPSKRTDKMPVENQTIAAVKAEPKPTPSQNVTINLIHRLVQRGVLTKEDADELIKQAEGDAATARAMAASAARKETPQTEETEPSLFAEPPPLPQNLANVNAAAATPPPLPPAEPNESDDDAVNVMYVPETVKRQLREDIKQEVMEQARNENWANPRLFPTWVLHFKPFADVRLRYEGIFFPSGNDTSGSTFQFVNFNAINTGAPFDLRNGVNFPPELNVDEDRQRARIRVRVGAQMDLEDGFTIGVRVATGETNTPTSTNQSLGAANSAQGGNFSKYAIWLDRAFLKYELGGKPSQDFVAEMGRFDNPYFTVSELMWDEDLGWDGLALSGKYRVAPGVTPFAAAGIFPVFNTELNFSSNQPDKFSSEDKWLYGGQAGVSLRFSKDFSSKIAGAFYDFYNIEGKLSDPFVPLSAADAGNTDDSRPSFAQHGNTYFPIRNITPTIDNGFGTTKQFQYFGLATPFRVVNFTGNLDFARFDPVHMTLFGEWASNVAFDYEDVNRIALNNRGPNRGNFDGGNSAWIVGARFGHPALERRWDWYAGVSYRYVESDATPDAFNDSDFGLGGTNLKGFTVYGGVAVSPHVSLGMRWLSADAIAGPPYRNDILQFDFNAKF